MNPLPSLSKQLNASWSVSSGMINLIFRSIMLRNSSNSMLSFPVAKKIYRIISGALLHAGESACHCIRLLLSPDAGNAWCNCTRIQLFPDASVDEKQFSSESEHDSLHVGTEWTGDRIYIDVLITPICHTVPLWFKWNNDVTQYGYPLNSSSHIIDIIFNVKDELLIDCQEFEFSKITYVVQTFMKILMSCSVYLKGSNFREFFFRIFFFISREEIFANQVFRDFSRELIFANEKIQLFGGILEMKEKLALHWLFNIFYTSMSIHFALNHLRCPLVQTS